MFSDSGSCLVHFINEIILPKIFIVLNSKYVVVIKAYFGYNRCPITIEYVTVLLLCYARFKYLFYLKMFYSSKMTLLALNSINTNICQYLITIKWIHDGKYCIK